MSEIQKSKSYRGETVLDRDIWNQRFSAYIGEHSVEVNSSRWSGRQTKPDAIQGIDELIELLQAVRREIVESTRTPGLHLSDIFEDEKVIPVGFSRCEQCDGTGMTVEHLSWRREIVEWEIKADERN